MTKTKSTKRALLMSALALVMCFSMLIGSTFAWFTDSVTSAGNKIVAGKLDVQLLMKTSAEGNYEDISGATNPIFGTDSIAQNNNAQTLWEPGKTQVAYLAIKNNGTLDLKYTVGLNVVNVKNDLYEVMEYAIVPDAQYDSVNSWTSGSSVVVGTQSVSGDVELKKGEIHYFALAIHMDEEAGNKYQEGEVDFDLTVLATQLVSESDSFGNQYDKDATYSVTSADAFYAAVANRAKSINIESDIELTKSVSIYNDMVIYGNGHEIKYAGTEQLANLISVSNNTALDVVFDNIKFNGNNNVKNGVVANKVAGRVEVNACEFSGFTYDSLQITTATGAEVIVTGNTFNANGILKRSLHIESDTSVSDFYKPDVKITVLNNVFVGPNTSTYVQGGDHAGIYGYLEDVLTVGGNTGDGDTTICIRNNKSDGYRNTIAEGNFGAGFVYVDVD